MKRGWSLARRDKQEIRLANPPKFKHEASVWTPKGRLIPPLNICTMMSYKRFLLVCFDPAKNLFDTDLS